jgi:hypothetical protein
VNETSTASAAALLVVVSVPGIDKFFKMFLNHAADIGQLVTPEASRLRQFDWFQPELCIFLGVFNVDMPRFAAFATEEEKPKTPLTPYFRHTPTLAFDENRSSSRISRTAAPVSAERQNSAMR